MKRIGFFLLLLLLTGGIAACGSSQTEVPTAAVIPTETPEPPQPTSTATVILPTSTPQPSPTATFTATPHPVGTMNAKISSENLNLRAGPSTIYVILASYPKDTSLVILGKAVGDEWVEVEMPDGKTGWMSVDLLTLDGEVTYLPIVDVPEGYLVTGRVIDSDAQPVDGSDVAVLQRLNNTTLRTDAITDQEGYFYVYLPKQSIGYWEAQVVGIGCSSRIVDENCNLKGYFVYTYRQLFQIPPISPMVFLYQAATTQITGTLSDAEGKPVSMRVFAGRSDGAYSYSIANTEGKFSIPVGDGIWDVYAIQTTTNAEGTHVTVSVYAGEEPAPISLAAPVAEE
jgi:SH3-like domain-containing protein